MPVRSEFELIKNRATIVKCEAALYLGRRLSITQRILVAFAGRPAGFS